MHTSSQRLNDAASARSEQVGEDVHSNGVATAEEVREDKKDTLADNAQGKAPALDALADNAPAETAAVDETATNATTPENVSADTPTQPENPQTEPKPTAVLGKNAKKRLRRQREQELRQAELGPAAEVADGLATTDEPQPISKRQKRKDRKMAKMAKNVLQERADKKVQLETEKQRLARRMEKKRMGREKMADSAFSDPGPSRFAAPASSSSSSLAFSPSKMPDEDAAGPRRRPLGKNPEQWQIQKQALQAKFPEGWNPRKKLSPDALEGIRALHRQFPETYTTAVLAQQFEVSVEAIRRILKSKWRASSEEEEDRQMRWFERGKRVWSRWAALGKKPPKRWQAEGILRDSSWTGQRQRQQGERQQDERQGRHERQERRTQGRQKQQGRRQYQQRLVAEGGGRSRETDDRSSSNNSQRQERAGGSDTPRPGR